MTDTAVRPRIDPRVARRWIEVRRDAGRRRLRVIVIAGAVLALVALAGGSFYTPIMKVRHVRVAVSGPMSAKRVESLAGLDRYHLMIDVHAGAVARRLDAVPQLAGAHVVVQWPSTVRVRVIVRTPVALIEKMPAAGQAAAWLRVDVTGRVLSSSPDPAAGLPVLSGVGDPPAVGDWISGSLGPSAIPQPKPAVDMSAASDSSDMPRGPAAALAAIAALPAAVRSDILGVSVEASGDLSMDVLPTNIAVGSIAVELGDGSQLARKLSALTALLGQADLSGVASVDLTVPDRPAALTAR